MSRERFAAKVLLDAFYDPAADFDRTGLISTTGLADYLAKRVPALTDDKQYAGNHNPLSNDVVCQRSHCLA